MVPNNLSNLNNREVLYKNNVGNKHGDAIEFLNKDQTNDLSRGIPSRQILDDNEEQQPAEQLKLMETQAEIDLKKLIE